MFLPGDGSRQPRALLFHSVVLYGFQPWGFRLPDIQLFADNSVDPLSQCPHININPITFIVLSLPCFAINQCFGWGDLCCGNVIHIFPIPT